MMNIKHGVLIIGCFFCYFATRINAASFDCEKAVTTVEKSICLNSELSELDEVLNVAYRRGLITSLNEKELKESQQKWLVRRNNCLNEKCLADLYWSRIEWLSKQPRAPMEYKLVMSKDDSVCSQALDSFNKHLNEEYPPQPPAYTPTNYRIHAPAEISPQWRQVERSSAWVTAVDLDWDGKPETILKDSRIDSGDKKSIFFDVFYAVESELTLDKYNMINIPRNHVKKYFISDTYSIEKSYGSGSFGNPFYDKTYIPHDGVTNITADEFDVLILAQKPYLTFVSNNYLDKIGDKFFEDWSERKWRIISQYYASENRASIPRTSSIQNELKDICYFVLIRNLNKENNS